MLEPAHTVITICGGYAETARMAGRSEVRIRRWEYTKEKGGTGGLIPADCQQVLLDAACAEGKDLRPEHFFARAGQPAPMAAATPAETSTPLSPVEDAA